MSAPVLEGYQRFDSSESSSSPTFAITIPSGCTGVLVHAVNFTIQTGATIDGVSCEEILQWIAEPNDDTQHALYWLNNPTVGAVNLVLSLSGGVDRHGLECIYFSGVDSTTPYAGVRGTYADYALSSPLNGEGSAIVFAPEVSPAVDDYMVWGALTWIGNPMSSNNIDISGGNFTYSRLNPEYSSHLTAGKVATSTSDGVSISTGNNYRAHWIVILKQSAGGGPVTVDGSYSSANSVRNYVSSSYSSANTVRGYVSNTYASSNTVKNYVASSYSGSSSVKNYVSNSYVVTYTIRNFVSGSYDASSSVTPPGETTSSFTGSSSVRNYVSSSYTVTYSVRNYISGTHSGADTVRNYISPTNVSYSNTVRNYVSSNYSSGYSIRNYVTGSYDASSSVEVAAGLVTGSYNSSNTVRNYITSEYSSGYSVNTYIAGSYNSSFAVYSIAEAEYSSAYTVYQSVENVFNSSYTIRNYVLSTFDGSSSTVGTVDGSYTGSYSIGQAFELSSYEAQLLLQIYRLHGLASGNPLVVSSDYRYSGDLYQDLNQVGESIEIDTVAGLDYDGTNVRTMVQELAAIYGLIDPMTVTATGRVAGAIEQDFEIVNGVTTVTRV
jgi:hypothetical protein